MPAPQASMMQQIARTKFTSFQIRVPTGWKEPSGDPAADHYSKSCKDSEKNTSPGTPPLFIAASMNKYHTDTQKMLISKFGDYIDGMCSAICSAWSQWQTTATMVGVMITAGVASVGQVVGPPWMPLIMASAPKNTPNVLKYSNVIATVIGTAWLSFTAILKIAPNGPPLYPAMVLSPLPALAGIPNIPLAFAQLIGAASPPLLNNATLKGQMIGQLGDPMAPFHKELFESISFAFEQCYNTWMGTTILNNIMGIAAGPGTPIVPAPMAGTGIMTPGGFT